MSTEVSSTLQIPDPALSTSRQHGGGRSASIAVQPSSAQSQQPSSSRRTRASHAVVSSSEQQRLVAEAQPTYQDVYSHPAAVAYAAAHPRRQIPRFGPYLLLQTLGEGEFGKVKLGLHVQWGEEVAVKLMRKGNIDSAVRQSKVQREIDVLQTLKHPHIVHLYDVIETDKYIGIIIEYASGGELFDHILAHRYLKERDAAKLFSQLISGVWYIHQKKIVHRDLKLENLLLDRHRNVIITDFGFANRFEHRSDDLMQTSCGSPCYAAPELVISEGLYVGSAVDIWSCGVILYAMLAGYLPFDDDPLNPDGDNINLLYKYIVNTPLSFPDYISGEARDLLSMMLVPDPAHRATLAAVMTHPWLSQHTLIFQRSVEELEQLANEQQQTKRLAYQKQMKQAAQAAQHRVTRSQTVKSVDPYAGKSRGHHYQSATQPTYLYETGQEPQRGALAVDTPAEAHVASTDDVEPMILPMDELVDSDLRNDSRGKRREDERARKHSTPAEEPKKKGGMRHTIQVEYGDSQQQEQHPQQSQQTSAPSQPRRVLSKKRDPEEAMADAGRDRAPLGETPSSSPTRVRSRTSRRPSQTSNKALPLPPSSAVPSDSEAPSDSQIASTVASSIGPSSSDAGQSSMASLHSQVPKRGKHRKGLSMDRIGLGKIFGVGPANEATNGVHSPSDKPAAATEAQQEKRPLTLQTLTGMVTPKASSKNSLLSPGGEGGKSSRRNTLTVMTEQFRSRKGKGKPAATNAEPKELAVETPPPHVEKRLGETPPSQTPNASTPFINTPSTDFNIGRGLSASTNKALRVMQFFRTKSKGRDLSDPDSSVLPLPTEEGQVHDATPTQAHFPRIGAPGGRDEGAAPEVLVTASGKARPAERVRVPSSAGEGPMSLATRVRRSVGLPMTTKGVMRTHHGAVDSKTTTEKPPAEVMEHVREVLVGMGIDLSQESDFKFRCVRAKRKKVAPGIVSAPSGSGGVAAFTMVGSAASNGVDKRGLPVPSSSSFGMTGGIIKGLLMRRQSSQISTSSGLEEEPSPSPVSTNGAEPLYGDMATDAGDEVRFSVELTRIEGLQLYSVDVRRLKGNLRSYKFLYDTVRERLRLGD